MGLVFLFQFVSGNLCHRMVIADFFGMFSKVFRNFSTEYHKVVFKGGLKNAYFGWIELDFLGYRRIEKFS